MSKKLLALLLLLAVSVAFAYKMEPTRLLWRSNVHTLVGVDTLWSKPIFIEPGSNFAFGSRMFSPQACSVGVYFKVGFSSTLDTTLQDKYFWSPTTEPGDSTILAKHVFAASDTAWWGANFWSEVCRYLMVGLYTPNNGATDTLMWIDSTWVFMWRAD